MQIHIVGTFEFDPFGIPMLKHNSPVNYTQALGENTTRINIPIGPLTLGAAVDIEQSTANTQNIVLDVKVALANFPVYDLKETLVNHVGLGAVKIGSTQLGFIGTITVTA